MNKNNNTLPNWAENENAKRGLTDSRNANCGRNLHQISTVTNTNALRIEKCFGNTLEILGRVN
ncbi:MAG: hypothetical protein ACTSWL_01180 [Promethearchaeota archaeon]